MSQALRGICVASIALAVLLLRTQAAAQSGTITDDTFIPSSTTTQSVNLNGQMKEACRLEH